MHILDTITIAFARFMVGDELAISAFVTPEGLALAECANWINFSGANER
jgi:hypothetical protein